jgi:hypothetical protein
MLPDRTIDRVCRLTLEAPDEVVARKGDDVIWVHRKEGTSVVDLVALDPPHLTDKDYLFQYFQEDNCARLLPILHFLRELSGWELPPLRACFMFDDPNLHWPSYGYVRYPELIQHALRHNYHVSFATVPFDSRYVHPPTAALFRENPSRISLLIHGNDHTHKELAQTYSDKKRQGIVAQALRRIERFERSSGLHVSRVMAAPHGACTEEMAKVLARTGFEAACISRGSIMAHNKNKVWPAAVGLSMAEFLGNDLPVIPRFGFGKTSRTQILLSAFLGQPVILVAHHEELAGGLELLQEAADFINSIDEVRWLDMKSIVRSNFCSRREDHVLHLEMYSRAIRFSVPENIRQLCIERPWLNGTNGEGLILRESEKTPERKNSYSGEPIEITPGADIEITSIHSDLIDPAKIPLPHTSLWAIARRHLCEGRDRLRPTIDRLFAFRTQGKGKY